LYDRQAYHSQSPENRVVHKQPSLLGIANSGLFLADTLPASDRNEDVVKGGSPQASEYYDPERDKLEIVPSLVVQASVGIVVGQGEVLGGAWA